MATSGSSSVPQAPASREQLQSRKQILEELQFQRRQLLLQKPSGSSRDGGQLMSWLPPQVPRHVACVSDQVFIGKRPQDIVQDALRTTKGVFLVQESSRYNPFIPVLPRDSAVSAKAKSQ
ncbi:unnamed protein product [Cyprideis torosa]|uniref:Uncharacterized protein n=1 Tax=Cyprideis torosa TaxID=163714 RepID=A0A7R8WF49_9CRUS|nr:unnamed protein product [Cyprideis torosa]CAG0896422.1 unnamed protein product [Cyprideis torosa]